MTSYNPEIADRIVVVKNPDSTLADLVQDEVITPFQEVLSESQLVEFVVTSTDVSESIMRLADVLKPGDRLLSLAGDGTANVAANAVIQAGMEGIRLGFLPYGNFNDIAATFTSPNARRSPVSLLTSQDTVEARPLQLLKDEEHYRYALLYANLGWTAQAAAIFDDPEVRKALQSGETGLPANLVRLGKSYFAERSTAALPSFQRDDEPTAHSSITDVLAINGPIMGKVIRSARPYYNGGQFLSSELDISSLLRNAGFLGRSALNLCFRTHFKLPGAEVGSMKLDFGKPVGIPSQTDGNYELIQAQIVTIAKDNSESTTGLHIIVA